MPLFFAFSYSWMHLGLVGSIVFPSHCSQAFPGEDGTSGLPCSSSSCPHVMIIILSLFDHHLWYHDLMIIIFSNEDFHIFIWWTSFCQSLSVFLRRRQGTIRTFCSTEIFFCSVFVFLNITSSICFRLVDPFLCYPRVNVSGPWSVVCHKHFWCITWGSPCSIEFHIIHIWKNTAGKSATFSDALLGSFLVNYTR